MKLKYLIFSCLAVAWVLFLIVSYLFAAKSFLIGFCALALLFTIIIVMLIKELLSEKLKIVSKNSTKADIIPESSHSTSDSPPLSKYMNRTMPPDYTALLQEFNESPLARFTHNNDKLMEFPNIVLFNQLFNKSLSHAKRHKNVLAILLVDVEPVVSLSPYIKRTLNSTAIVEVGNRLASVLRTEDILAKLDGNEFIVLLSDIDQAKFAGTVAKKLLNACAPFIYVDYHELILRTSIGICVFPNDGSSLEELIKNAYHALNKAKNIDGDSYQFYTEKLDVEAHEYNNMDMDLRKAIQNNELILYYQPKLRIKDGNIAGVEALIRWMHPELGMLTPASFMSVAEESGLIAQIGEWALREACRNNKYWQNEGYEHLSVAINLSPKQFYQPNTLSVISSILQETELAPHLLELEISEATIMSTPEKSIEIINALKEIGVKVSIDHFGTGYTSINHLKQFPVTSLKIDRSFIKDIPNKPDDAAIASTIISLGHNLGMEVVAEGVENAEQMQYLAMQGCDIVQGYFLSYPEPAQNIVLQFKKLSDQAII